MIGPVIPDLDSALAYITSVAARADLDDTSQPTPHVREGTAQRDNIHLYALTRSASGHLLMGHVSHSSHSSHSSGVGHNSHASHVSHTSHASHVSGTGHSSHVSGSNPPPPATHGLPDLRIGEMRGALHGNNIYGSAKRQTVEQAGRRGRTLKWQISVQNDAKVADAIRVRGAKSARGFKVKYLSANGTNITRAVEAGTFRTPRLSRGAAYRLTVVVKVTRRATPGRALTGKVQAHSVLTPGRTDAVAFVAQRS